MHTKNTSIKLISIILIVSNCSMACFAQDSKENKQLETFDSFWHFFDTHYASFPEKAVNWDSVYTVNNAKVKPTTTNEELFTIFKQMVLPLHDAHITVKSPDGKIFSASRPSRIKQEFAKTEGLKRTKYNAMVDSTLRSYNFINFKNWGKKLYGNPFFQTAENEKYGYLRINRFHSNQLMIKGLFTSSKINAIFKQFEKKEGLIIDIRFNPGGQDAVAKNVAGHLTCNPVIGYYKQTKIEGQPNTFTPLEEHWIKPIGRTTFTKPVILLTNDCSVSAADVMALILMHFQNVTIIGENTNGSFSDIFPGIRPKKLPHGWKITLSNQRYLSADKINYEGKGIPVNVEVRNMLPDLDSMSDPVLIKALDILKQPLNR